MPRTVNWKCDQCQTETSKFKPLGWLELKNLDDHEYYSFCSYGCLELFASKRAKEVQDEDVRQEETA